MSWKNWHLNLSDYVAADSSTHYVIHYVAHYVAIELLVKEFMQRDLSDVKQSGTAAVMNRRVAFHQAHDLYVQPLDIVKQEHIFEKKKNFLFAHRLATSHISGGYAPLLTSLYRTIL